MSEEKKKRISVSSSKSKGRRLQQKVAKLISELLDIPWGVDELISSRIMGGTGVDVALIGEAKRRMPYSIECKAQEKWSVFSWINQAKANQMPGTDWLLICSKNNFKPVVIIDWEVYYYIHSKVPDFKIKTGGIYDFKAWKLQSWIEKARSQNKKEPWVMHCRNSEKYVVAVMELSHFFDLLKTIPSDVKR